MERSGGVGLFLGGDKSILVNEVNVCYLMFGI